MTALPATSDAGRAPRAGGASGPAARPPRDPGRDRVLAVTNMGADQAIEQFVNALTIGAIYALIALGYTMVYGIIELINFAHGDMFMVGAFVA